MAMVPRKTANSRGLQTASSSSQTLGKTSVDFSKNFKGRATLNNGTVVMADYAIHRPTGGRGYFHMLLDASGSMFAYCEDGRNHVYEHLFKCFEDLVESGEATRPKDIICVWSFNKRTKLLCEVETKDFHRRKDFIREEYKKELSSSTVRGETRLYDAVGIAMEKISKTCETDKTADFFLVPFTDGMDSRTGTVSLDRMVSKILELVGRLHTFFITVNLQTNSDFYKTLKRQKEMKLIICESTKTGDISQAFNTLRGLIKAVLVTFIKEAGAVGLPPINRIVEYAETEEAITDAFISTLATGMQKTSLLQAYNELKLTYY